MASLEQQVSELRELVKDMVYAQRRTDMRFEEFVNEMREFKDEMREFKDEMKKSKKDLDKKWGDLANRLGTVVEDIIAPGIPDLAKKYFGCNDFEAMFIRPLRKSKDKTKLKEFDLVYVCDNLVILNETKTSPNQEYIDQFHEIIENEVFFDFFPEYRDRPLIPVFSTLQFSNPRHVELLTERGIYAAQLKGENLEIVNFNQLRSK